MPIALSTEFIWSAGHLADSRAVADLAAAAFDPHFREAWVESQIAGIMKDKGGWMNLARTPEGELAAFALNRQTVDEVELLLCATHPEFRQLGLGRRLIKNLCASSRARGGKRIYLEVRATNHIARKLYHSCGFIPCGVRPAYYHSLSGETVDAITLEYRL